MHMYVTYVCIIYVICVHINIQCVYIYFRYVFIYICVHMYMYVYALTQITTHMDREWSPMLYVCMNACRYVCVCVHITDTIGLMRRLFPLKMSPGVASKPRISAIDRTAQHWFFLKLLWVEIQNKLCLHWIIFTKNCSREVDLALEAIGGGNLASEIDLAHQVLSPG